MSILVVGSIAFDKIETPFGKVDKVLGGSAVHFALAASILSKVYIIGTVGNDFSTHYINYLKTRNINIDGITKEREGKTFYWEGYYDFDMHHPHTVKTNINVFEDFKPYILDSMQDTPYVFLANIDPDIQLKILKQIKTPKLIVCDTMNYWIQKKKDKILDVFKQSDIILCTDAEARQLFETPNLSRAARQAMDLGVKTVIIKKGEHGTIMYHADNIFTAPVLPFNEIIDPTGAGDSFAGGLLSFLEKTNKIDEETLRQAVVYGTIIASFSVQDFGVKGLETLTYNDIKRRYVNLCSITKFKGF